MGAGGDQAPGRGVLRRRRGRHHARAARPADGARALAQRRARGHGAGHRRAGAGSYDKAEAFYSKRTPKGAPDYLEEVEVTFPSGRTAKEICPTEIATVAWAAHMGTITFHPWPVRRADVDHPDELRIDLDPQPGTDFADAARVALAARDLLTEVGLVGFPKTSGNRGRPRLRADRAGVGLRRPAPLRDRVRARAGASYAGRDDGVVEGGARGEHLRRLQPELPRPHHRQRLLAAAQARGTGLHAGRVGRARRASTRARSTCTPCRERLAERGDAMAAIDEHPGRPRHPAADVRRRHRRRPDRHALPAGLPQDAGGAAAGAAEPRTPVGGIRATRPTLAVLPALLVRPRAPLGRGCARTDRHRAGPQHPGPAGEHHLPSARVRQPADRPDERGRLQGLLRGPAVARSATSTTRPCRPTVVAPGTSTG